MTRHVIWLVLSLGLACSHAPPAASNVYGPADLGAPAPAASAARPERPPDDDVLLTCGSERALPPPLAVAVSFGDAEYDAALVLQRQVHDIELRADATTGPASPSTEKMRKRLAAKLKSFADARAAYLRILERVPAPAEQVAVLYRLAELHTHVADSVLQFPAPAELTPEQQQIFCREFSRKAAPIFRQALNYADRCAATPAGPEVAPVVTACSTLRTDLERDFRQAAEASTRP